MADAPLIDIRPDHWAIVQRILQKHVPQYAVWAFGSRAQWEAKQYSDLDLAIITDKPLPLNISASLSEDLSESDLPYKVDVVDWATTSESFRKIINRDKVVVQAGTIAMASGWTKSTLGSIAKFYSGGTPNKQKAAYWGGTIPWISATSLKTPRIFDSDRRITDEGLHAGSRLAKEGDVLLLVRGSALHQEIPVGITIRDVAFNQDIKALRAQAGIAPDFLFYQLQGRSSELLSMVEFTGIGAGKLDTQKLQSLPVRLPDFEEQRRIARIFSSLDDKIDHNRALAANLEAIARRLFKSWFVDFDPVRAKAAGEKPPGLAEDIAALFPDRFVESELGEIPERWLYQPITSISSVLSGGTPKRAIPEYWGGNIPWYSVVDAPQGSDVFVVQTSENITTEGLKKSAAKLLPPGATILSARGTVGKLALTCSPMTINQSCYALKGDRGDFFTYFTIANSLEWLKQNVHGAVFDTITKATLEGVMVVTPSKDTTQVFENAVKPLMGRIEICVREQIILANIRDLLLPRLISGRLRVEHAESMIEEAVV